MRRRELIRLIAGLTGAAFVGADAAGSTAGRERRSIYSRADVRFFDEVAETILPRTDTPGAKDAEVGAFIARYSAGRYEPAHLAIVKDGIAQLDARMRAMHGLTFMRASADQKRSVLLAVDAEAKRHEQAKADADRDRPPHYFTLMKQLTLYGFFTSEAGATRVVRYRPVPGKYEGCVPYARGETFWAW